MYKWMNEWILRVGSRRWGAGRERGCCSDDKIEKIWVLMFRFVKLRRICVWEGEFGDLRGIDILVFIKAFIIEVVGVV